MTRTYSCAPRGAIIRSKKRSTAFLENVANGSVEAAIDTEVLQDILHRYRALGRWAEGRQVYDTARLLFPAAAAITNDVMNRTRVLMDEYSGLMARDAPHIAVVLTHRLDWICSFDRHFDRVGAVRRIEP